MRLKDNYCSAPAFCSRNKNNERHYLLYQECQTCFKMTELICKRDLTQKNSQIRRILTPDEGFIGFLCFLFSFFSPLLVLLLFKLSREMSSGLKKKDQFYCQHNKKIHLFPQLMQNKKKRHNILKWLVPFSIYHISKQI